VSGGDRSLGQLWTAAGNSSTSQPLFLNMGLKLWMKKDLVHTSYGPGRGHQLAHPVY